MLLIKLQHITPFLKSTSLLTQIADEADMKLSSRLFTIIASDHSSRFVAVLKIKHQFFAIYVADPNHSSRFSLHSLHNAMLDGSSSPSMTIHIMDRLILRFEESRYELEKRYELNLSPPGEEDLVKIDYGRYCNIDSDDFGHIIPKLSVYEDEICVTITVSQVKFSVATEEIIFTKEDRECTILGYDGEDKTTQFLITLDPMLFFLDLISEAGRVWFYKTIESRGVMRVDFDMLSYLIYFRHM